MAAEAEKAGSKPTSQVKSSALGPRLALTVGFGGVLALMGVAGVDSIRALGRIESINTRLTRTYLTRHHALERIRSQLITSGTDVRDYFLVGDPSEAQGYLNNLLALREGMDRAIEEYSTGMHPEEVRLFSQLRDGLHAYWHALTPVFTWNPKQRRDSDYDYLEKEIFPRRQAIIQITDRIDLLNEQALNAGERLTAEMFASFRRWVLVMLGTTLGLGLILAALTIAHVLRLEREARLRYEETLRARGALERLSSKLVAAQEEERRSISRELHDEVGQALSALLLDLGNLAALTPPDSAATRGLLDRMKKLAEGSLNAVRNMSLLLRPSMLDDLGLVPALRWQARELWRRTGIQVDVTAEGVSDDLPDEHKTCVYRLVQEALHNSSRHSAARNVRVCLEQEPNEFRMTIEDDGTGFEPRQTRGLGLLGMEERVKNLGGSFRVESGPARGTLLTIRLPLSHRETAVEPSNA